jgi:hypothetical protein
MFLAKPEQAEANVLQVLSCGTSSQENEEDVESVSSGKDCIAVEKTREALKQLIKPF